MGLLGSLTMLLFLLCLSCSQPTRAQQSPNGSSSSSARELDALLQDYAFRAFVRPRTGVRYDGAVPLNLTGVQVSAMRLRSGSLRRKGVPIYREFEIPIGVIVQPYVERLVLVYQNLGNWSSIYYPLPDHTYLAPIFGLLAYNASNLLAKNLPELDIRASLRPISIKFPDVRPVPDGLVAKCVWFALNGSVNYSNLVSSNICSTFEQGHFSIVVKSIGPTPTPVSPAPPPPSTKPAAKKNKARVGIIAGSVLGGLALLVLLGLLVLWGLKYKHRKKMHKMEKSSEAEEALRMTTVGRTKAPTATETRTQPTLENEYMP